MLPSLNWPGKTTRLAQHRPASATIILNSVSFCWIISPTLPTVTVCNGPVAWFSSSNIWQSDFQRQRHAFERQQRARTSKKEVLKAVDLAHLLTYWPPRIACQVGSNKVVARAELVTCIYMGHYVNGRFSASGTVHQMSGEWHEGNETQLQHPIKACQGCSDSCSSVAFAEDGS